MIIFKDIEQGSEQWLKLRNGKVTGSTLKDLMAKDNLPLIDRLIAEIVSEQSEETFKSIKMQRGSDMEPIARKAYEKYSGEKVEQVGFLVSEKFEWFGYSPDGLIEKDGKYKKGIEIKCPDTDTHVKYIRQNKLPKEYYYQVLGGFIVNEDLEYVDFISYDNRFTARPIHIIPVYKQDFITEINEIDGQMEKFWEKFLKYYQDITF